MDIGDVKKAIEGAVVRTPPRALDEHEMARIVGGGGPRINPGGDDEGCRTVTYDIVNGVAVPGDCLD